MVTTLTADDADFNKLGTWTTRSALTLVRGESATSAKPSARTVARGTMVVLRGRVQGKTGP